MIEIKQGESGVYDFSLEISGDATGQPELRMVIAHPNGYMLAFPTQRFENGGGYRVTLPCLDAILPCGSHPFGLEVLLGDRIFRPLQDTLRIIEPPSVAASMTNAAPVAPEPVVTATFNPQPVQQPEVKVAPSYAYEAKAPVKPIITPEPVKPAEVVKEAVKEVAKPVKPAVKKVSDTDLGIFNSLLKKK